MAGQPKRRAMIAELSKRSLEDLDDAGAHLEYVADWVKSGRTIVELANSISDSLHLTETVGNELRNHTVYGINARMVSKYLVTTWPETATAAMAGARQEGAHGLVAEAMSIADEVSADREEIAKAKLRVDTRLWAAERWNRDELGKAPETVLNVNLNTLHLEAMREMMLRAPAKESAGRIPLARAFLIPESSSTIDATIEEIGVEANTLPDQQLDLLTSGL